MDTYAARKAAQLLSDARLKRTRLVALPEDIRPSDEDDAYLVQESLHEYLTEAGLGQFAGYKIGCTTPVMQKYLGIPNPCAGRVFERTTRSISGTYRYEDFMRPGVECEIAARLKADLPPSGAPYDISSVAPALDSVMASIEIVDDRWEDYKAIDTPSLIADDFFAAGCVQGPPVPWTDQEIVELEGSMWVNGDLIGTGRGGDILGHPLAALAWLANLMAGRGKSLLAGEFVSLGSIVQTSWVNKGDVVKIDIGGLGKATAVFE